MQKIKTTEIKQGQRFEHALFMSNGQKLLNAGVEITSRHLRVFASLSDSQLYLADSIDELVAEGVVKAIDRGGMRLGQKADRDVLAAGGTLLIEQGQEIEQHHMDAMSGGAYSAQRDQELEQARLRRDRMVMADALIEQLEQDVAGMNLRITPQATDIWHDAPTAATQWPAAGALIAEREGHVQTIRSLMSQIEAGIAPAPQRITTLVDALFDRLLLHPQHVTQLALLCKGRDKYLPDHAFCVCVLAMATAAQLKWSEQHVKQIGRVGLLADVGMLLVPERIRTGGCALTEIDRGRVQRHPAFTLALLENVDGFDPVMKLAAFEHHERETGVGYPRGVRGDQICDMAKVLGVADVFAAAVSYRSYHASKLPYVVMEELIRSAAAGIFCKQSMRALVQAAGLFPVGSYVMLSNRRLAHVLATNVKQLDRPIIRILNDDGQPTEHVIDLTQFPVDKLAVARPAPPPASAAA